MTVCMLVTNAVTNDPRVRKEAATLAKSGYQVVVIGLATNSEHKATEWLDGYLVLRLHHPKRLLSFHPRMWLAVRLRKAWPNGYGRLRAWYQRVRTRHPDRGGSGVSGWERTWARRVPTYWAKLRADATSIVSLLYINLAMARTALRQKADIYHSHDLDTLLAGYIAARAAHAKLVYDLHELYVEQFGAGVKTSVWRGFYSALERVLVRKADLKLTVSEGLGKWVCDRYGVREVITIMNVPECQPAPVVGRCAGREPVILYQGLYFRDRGLEQLIECAQYLERGRIVLRGYGYLEEQLRNLVKSLKLEAKVEFALPVAVNDLVKAAAEADIGVAPFLPVCANTTFCLPNKLFEYMMAGLAIAASDLPEMRKVVKGHGLGVVFDPSEPRLIAEALNELMADDLQLQAMRQRAREAAVSIYNWAIEQGTFLAAYERLSRP